MMQKKYELVLLLHPMLVESERLQFIRDIETALQSFILEKDDIGLLSLVYGLKGKKDLHKAYFVSYHLQADSAGVDRIKKELLYSKYILRYFLYVMYNDQKFWQFHPLQDKLQKILHTQQEDTKFSHKVAFFADEKNISYISWKSLPILRQYLTRFGDIKPRKYVHNSVKVQKRVRKAIIRARELGLLPYISN